MMLLNCEAMNAVPIPTMMPATVTIRADIEVIVVGPQPRHYDVTQE